MRRDKNLRRQRVRPVRGSLLLESEDMKRAELTKTTPKGSEEYVLEVHGATLRAVRMFNYRRATEVKETPCATEARAEATLDALVAKLEKNGYVRDADSAPRKPSKKAGGSKARTVHAPAWFGKLPDVVHEQRNKLAALAKKAGLAHRWPEIEAMARLGIHLTVKPTKSTPKDVVSRLGGAPDLPASIAWLHGCPSFAPVLAVRSAALKVIFAAPLLEAISG